MIKLMKKLKNKQKKYFLIMLSLIAICEILLRIDNTVVQLLGICIAPIIVIYGILLLKNDQKSIQKKEL